MGFFAKKKLWIPGALLLVAAVTVGLLFVFDVFGKKQKKPEEPGKLMIKEYPEECVIPTVPDGSVLLVKQVTKVRILQDGTKIPRELSEYDDKGCLLRYDSYSVYGDLTETFSYTYNEQRQVTSVTYENFLDKYTGYKKIQYDEKGRIVAAEYLNFDNVDDFPDRDYGARQEEYKYDEDGKLITYQIYYKDKDSRSRTDYSYDDSGRLILTVTSHSDGTFEESRYTYDEAGTLRQVTLNINYADFHFGYLTYKSESFFDEKGTQYLQKHYTDGQLYMETEFNAQGEELKTISYDNGKIYVSSRNEYDEENRLTRCTGYDSDGSVYSDFLYEYDSMGNRTASYSYDFDTQTYVKTTEADYSFDDAGNVTAEKVRLLTTDGKLIVSVEAEYTSSGSEKAKRYYDADGNITYSVTNFYDAYDNLIRQFVHGDFDNDGEALPDYEMQYRYLAFAVPSEQVSEAERAELTERAEQQRIVP